MLLATWLTYVLGWFALLATVSIVSLFLRRKLYRELPLFLVYIASVLFIAAIRYATLHAGTAIYFYAYWITDLAGAPMVFLALYEVFMRRLFVGFQRTRFFRNLFLFVAVVIVLLTVFSASHAHDKRAAFLAASQAFDFMRTAFLVFFVALMLLMGRTWTRYDLGISLGFGIQAAVALVNSAFRIRLRYRPAALDTAEFIAYDIACVIWLATFWRTKAPAPLPSQDQLTPELLAQAKSWEAGLKDLVKSKKDSE